MNDRPLSVLILAAGKGTRMKSGTAKVLHPLLGRPLIAYALDLARSLDAVNRGVVVGHQADRVSAAVPAGEFDLFTQRKQSGTGHAVTCALPRLGREGDLVVLSGDTPLLRPATLRKLAALHRRRGAALTLLTAEPPDPGGYGRVIRGRRGQVEAVVEHGDATAEERRIAEVNAGVYCFDLPFLARALKTLRPANRQGELYLTDVVAAAAREGLPLAALKAPDAAEMFGVNDRVDLAGAASELRRRTLEGLMRRGVTVSDPATVWVEPTVRVGRDTVLLPGTILEGETRVGAECRIGPWARVCNSTLGKGVWVRDACLLEGVRAGVGCQIGPFAHLRPGTVLGRRVKVGNFVEVKKSSLGEGSKASHLSYLGDARIGREVNIGAGTITCNYDGLSKWETVIEDGVFVGSDTQLVAPLRVGRGALIGAGSTVTRDVPAHSLTLSRTPQKNLKGMARRRFGKKG